MLIKPFKLLGGGKYDLTGETRISYLWKCNQLFSDEISGTTYEQIIKELLDIILEKTQFIINDNKEQEYANYDDPDDPDKTWLDFFYETLQEYMDSILTDIPNRRLNINTLNIVSIQCILIMEVFEYRKLAKKGLRPIILENLHYWYYDNEIVQMLKKYYEGVEFDKFNDPLYDENGKIIINPERNYDLLADSFLSLMIKSKYDEYKINFPTFDDIRDYYIEKHSYIYDPKYDIPIPSHSCPNLKGAFILCFVGEMTLLELVESFVNEIYLIGIAPEITFADARNMSPWTFFNHDIGHCSTLKLNVNSTIIKQIKIFFYKVMKNKHIIGNYKFDAIINILFYYYHEFPFYFVPIIDDLDLLDKTIDDLDLLDKTIDDLNQKYIFNDKNYRNPYFYNHILPEHLWFENNIKNKSFELHIKEYLLKSLQLFIILWNTFIRQNNSHIPDDINLRINSIISEPSESSMKYKYLKYKTKYELLKNKWFSFI
jgi:hypothetical protein